MIGNDIIDLNLARLENKAGNPRYCKKIFTEKERDMIENSLDREEVLWTFWAMKETAYKAHQRRFGLPRKINPLDYECNSESSVTIENWKYSIELDKNQNFIHCYTHRSKLKNYIYLSREFNEHDFLSDLKKQNPFINSELSIEKDGYGIPSIHMKSTSETIPFSLSHHGRFTAFVIPLINS